MVLSVLLMWWVREKGSRRQIMTSLTVGREEKEQMLPNIIKFYFSYNKSEMLKDPPRQDTSNPLKTQPGFT